MDRKNLYEQLHARPSISIEAPKIMSTIAFLVGDPSSINDNELTLKYLSEQKINKFIKDICDSYREKYKNSNIFVPNLKTYIDFNIQQSIYSTNNKYFVIFQNRTSFFSIIFIEEPTIVDETNEWNEIKWNAIPDHIKNLHDWDKIIEKALFKTHINVRKHELNRIEKGYHLKEIFNCKADHGDKINDVFIELFGSKVSSGRAFVWTPFRSFVHGYSDGFNRILVSADKDFKSGRLGRLVRRVVEIDLYTTIACQYFYKSKKQLKELRAVEKNLSNSLKKLKIDDDEISKKIKKLRKLEEKIDDYDEKKIDCQIEYRTEQSKLINELKNHTENYEDYYKQISDMAAENARIIAESRYEFKAVVAYSDIVSQRINELREEYLEGWTRISYFLERTFRPGVRTCQAVLELQNSVSQQIQGAANLLEAGLSLQLQEQEEKTLRQNKKILSNVASIMEKQDTIEKKERKFHKIVEFLAIVPITYYVSYIVEKVSGCKSCWILSVIITFTISFFLLFTEPGSKIIEKLLNLFNSSEKNRETNRSTASRSVRRH